MPEVPALRRYARSLVLNEHRADDLVRECLSRALEQPERLLSRGDLRLRLLALLRSTFVDAERQEGATGLAEATAGFFYPMTNVGAAPISLRIGLARLPTSEREALTLIVMEGLSYEDAAEIVGVDAATIRSRVVRARSALMNVSQLIPPPPNEASLAIQRSA